MDTKFCLSCGMPINETTRNDALNDYCKFCTTPEGTLKSREEVAQGLSEYCKMLQPDIDDAKASNRAAYYMKAMPAWAED